MTPQWKGGTGDGLWRPGFTTWPMGLSENKVLQNHMVTYLFLSTCNFMAFPICIRLLFPLVLHTHFWFLMVKKNKWPESSNILNQHVLVLKAMGFWYSTSHTLSSGNQSHGLLEITWGFPSKACDWLAGKSTDRRHNHPIIIHVKPSKTIANYHIISYIYISNHPKAIIIHVKPSNTIVNSSFSNHITIEQQISQPFVMSFKNLQVGRGSRAESTTDSAAGAENSVPPLMVNG